mmetsp:Transcript_12384/g.35990  ORF Transcript_12384/g.35990 Transcript_12384/m.35990 type:complete len:98 (-) Transcript_12384:499-792(-)
MGERKGAGQGREGAHHTTAQHSTRLADRFFASIVLLLCHESTAKWGSQIALHCIQCIHPFTHSTPHRQEITPHMCGEERALHPPETQAPHPSIITHG